jgi:hypothetical protein
MLDREVDVVDLVGLHLLYLMDHLHIIILVIEEVPLRLPEETDPLDSFHREEDDHRYVEEDDRRVDHQEVEVIEHLLQTSADPHLHDVSQAVEFPHADHPQEIVHPHPDAQVEHPSEKDQDPQTTVILAPNDAVQYHPQTPIDPLSSLFFV